MTQDFAFSDFKGKIRLATFQPLPPTHCSCPPALFPLPPCIISYAHTRYCPWPPSLLPLPTHKRQLIRLVFLRTDQSLRFLSLEKVAGRNHEHGWFDATKEIWLRFWIADFFPATWFSFSTLNFSFQLDIKNHLWHIFSRIIRYSVSRFVSSQINPSIGLDLFFSPVLRDSTPGCWSVCPSVRHTTLFGFCGVWPHCSCPSDQVTSNTAPAHPHATEVAVYTALFK